MTGIHSGYGVAIDLGTSYTTGCLFDRSVVRPLEFAGAQRVPSAVLLDEDGRIVAGERAQRSALTRPDRVERTPKLAVGRPFIILGGQTVRVADALAALLRLVADEAVRQRDGQGPQALVLTHPAGWGAERQNALVEAARVAGLPSPTLIPEPVAAASRYLSGVPIGTTVAVYDLGGGTFDTAVVAATEEGPAVISEPGGLTDIGGDRFDHALFRLLIDHLEERNPGVTEPILHSAERRWQRAALDLLDEARRAKEALSTQVRTSAYLPLLDAEIQLTRSELENLIRADIDATVEELDRTLDVAGMTEQDIQEVELVGGSSRIPLVASSLRPRFGDRLRSYDDPKLVLVAGAAGIGQRTLLGPLESEEPTVAFESVAPTLELPAVAGPVDQPPDAGRPGEPGGSDERTEPSDSEPDVAEPDVTEPDVAPRRSPPRRRLQIAGTVVTVLVVIAAVVAVVRNLDIGSIIGSSGSGGTTSSVSTTAPTTTRDSTTTAPTTTTGSTSSQRTTTSTTHPSTSSRQSPTSSSTGDPAVFEAELDGYGGLANRDLVEFLAEHRQEEVTLDVVFKSLDPEDVTESDDGGQVITFPTTCQSSIGDSPLAQAPAIGECATYDINLFQYPDALGTNEGRARINGQFFVFSADDTTAILLDPATCEPERPGVIGGTGPGATPDC